MTALPIIFCPDTLHAFEAELPAAVSQHVCPPLPARLVKAAGTALDRYARHGCARCHQTPQASSPWHLIGSKAGQPRIVCPECLRGNDPALHVGASIVPHDFGRNYDRLWFAAHPGISGVFRPPFHLEIRSLIAKGSYASSRFIGPNAGPAIDPRSNAICVVQVAPGQRMRYPIYARDMVLSGEEAAELFETVDEQTRYAVNARVLERQSSQAEQAYMEMATMGDALAEQAGSAIRMRDIALAAYEADQRPWKDA